MLVLAVAACATVDADRATLDSAPSRDPVRTRTSFADALRCLDRKVRTISPQVIPPRVFWVADIADDTRSVATGARSMAEGAILAAARSSRRFSVKTLFLSREGIPFDNPQAVPASAANEVDYVIRGSVSSFDRNVQDGQVGAGVSVQDVFNLSASRQDITNILSLDLTLLDPRTRLARAYSSNSIVLSFQDQGANLGGEIGKFGASFNFNIAKANGTGQAVRTLIELGIIELLGEELRLPYWECLAIPATNPEVADRVYDWWNGMGGGERRAYLRARLVGLGYLAPEADEAAYTAALARFQASVGLTATGRPGYETYAALLDETPAAKPVYAASTPPPQAPPPGRSTRAAPNLRLAAFYDQNAGYLTQISLDEAAYVACYLRLADGSYVRFLPNPFQNQRFYRAGDFVVPDAQAIDDFQIRPGNGEFGMGAACYATGQDVGSRLPEWLRQPAFQVLDGAELERITAAYENASPGFFDWVAIPLPPATPQ